MHPVITARKRSLRKLCFHRCLSVHRRGVCPIACWDTPLPQAHPQADTPLGRHPPWADNPPWEDNPHGQTTPLADTPLLHSACWDTVNKRSVHIPLECILVSHKFTGNLQHTCPYKVRGLMNRGGVSTWYTGSFYLSGFDTNENIKTFPSGFGDN